MNSDILRVKQQNKLILKKQNKLELRVEPN